MIKRNSAEWKEMAKNARLLTAEIKGVENELKMTQSRFSGFTAGFNKYFAMGATALASITGFSLTPRKIAEENAKVDDIYADVMKTTSMTKDEVIALNEELKKQIPAQQGKN